MGMGFQFEQHGLGLWDLSWDLKKNGLVGNGIRTPLHDPRQTAPPQKLISSLLDCIRLLFRAVTHPLKGIKIVSMCHNSLNVFTRTQTHHCQNCEPLLIFILVRG